MEISDLLSKGFTPDQIMQLVNSEHSGDDSADGGQDPGQESEHSENESGAGGQDPGQESEHSNDPAPAADPAVAEMRNEIKSLRELLQKQNIIGQHFDNPPNHADAENILAGIIRPPFDDKQK